MSRLFIYCARLHGKQVHILAWFRKIWTGDSNKRAGKNYIFAKLSSVCFVHWVLYGSFFFIFFYRCAVQWIKLTEKKTQTAEFSNLFLSACTTICNIDYSKCYMSMVKWIFSFCSLSFVLCKVTLKKNLLSKKKRLSCNRWFQFQSFYSRLSQLIFSFFSEFSYAPNGIVLS